MDRVPCRYFHGTGCRYGDACRFSHSAETADLKQEPCKFYLQGHCAAGDACSFFHDPNRCPAAEPAADAAPGDALQLELQALTLDTPAGDTAEGHADPPAAGADQPVCQAYARSGICSRGASCRHAHGLWCQTCGRFCLHPSNAQEREQHQQECGARAQRRAALHISRQVECCICLERVMDKVSPADRQFGLLDCEHPFCLACIRGWRSHLDGGADLDSALRTCPVCRNQSWFVTPSRTWPATPDEKAGIRTAYMSRLATIDCKHFNFGDGSCPFGSSCFYRHADRNGLPLGTPVRWYRSADGENKSYQRAVLSEFLAESGLIRN